MAIKNAIGVFNFVTMTPAPMGMRFQGIVEARPGVNDVAVWRTSWIGQSWECRTFVDCTNVAAGLSLARYYEQAVFADSNLGIMWDGFVMPFQVNVLKVGEIEVKQVLGKVGGFHPLNRAFIKASWLLLSRPWYEE